MKDEGYLQARDSMLGRYCHCHVYSRVRLFYCYCAQTAALNSSCTASQPASTNGQGAATICLVQPSRFSSVQVARRGHSASQPTLLLLGYFALLFACALPDLDWESIRYFKRP